MPSFFKCCEYWIFDLDGTLTLPVHDFEYIRKELMISPDEDILQHLADLSPSVRQKKTERLDQLEHFYALQAKSAPGVYSLLESLSEKKCQLGIVTRNTKAFTQLSLSVLNLSEYFDEACIIGRDDALPKPDPHGIDKLLSFWGVPATDSVMVGDYKYDLMAGRAAGCKTAHISTNHDLQWPELTDYRYTSLAQLATLI
ncbi:HAD family hydrolase [Neptunomonas japonica]|uniref:HAD family hydrolase n=1 Tax=Neptunomonas japonica JAMM 1380 TaxID=1441457 RepID=A0A7R6PPB6_9GAMM|nr:HAD-IA family hydrolase [Neptunomonas japonica]BBB30147.1 HAD family hydrolase [Neptunomonas japonica JAMM 1380]